LIKLKCGGPPQPILDSMKSTALRMVATTALAWGVAMAAVYAASEVPQPEPARDRAEAQAAIAGLCFEL